VIGDAVVQAWAAGNKSFRDTFGVVSAVPPREELVAVAERWAASQGRRTRATGYLPGRHIASRM